MVVNNKSLFLNSFSEPSKPYNLKSTSHNPHNVTVEWETPTHKNGKIKYYIVTWRADIENEDGNEGSADGNRAHGEEQEGSGDDRNSNETPATSADSGRRKVFNTNVTISGLRACVSYIIEVNATTGGGSGEAANLKHLMSNEGETYIHHPNV